MILHIFNILADNKKHLLLKMNKQDNTLFFHCERLVSQVHGPNVHTNKSQFNTSLLWKGLITTL